MHPVLGCLDAAERRRAFGRALRVPKIDAEHLDTTEVRTLLQSGESGSTDRAAIGTPITEPPDGRKQVDPNVSTP